MMPGRRQWTRRGTLMLLTAAFTVPAPAAEPEPLQDRLSRDWYYTEVIVFERPKVQEHLLEEALARRPAALPRNLRTFRNGEEAGWPTPRLYGFTRAFTAFPSLDVSRLPSGLRQAQLFGIPELATADRRADAAGRAQDAQRDGIAGAPPPAIQPRLAADPLLDFLRELAAFEAGLEADSYRWLDAESFTLTGAARRLERRGGYRVLLHGRWLQPVPDRASAEPLLVRAGPRYGDTAALEGTLDVTLGRYLHFRARLNYTEPLMGRAPVSRALAPLELGSEAAPGRRLTARDFDRGVMHISESRRMRSEELHYLDHPKLGVLVIIEPAQPPASLSAAYAALEEGDE